MVQRVIVEGVLESDPGGVASGRRFENWSLVLELMPWRLKGSAEAPKTPLRIEIPITERKLEESMARLGRGTMVRVALERAPAAPTKKTPWSLARGRLPVRKGRGSVELRAEAAAHAEPVVIRDRVLGKLVLDRAHDWFTGRFEYEGKRCVLHVERSAREDEEASDLRDIARATRALSAITRGRAAIRRAIESKMLPLYNDNWRGDRPRITAARLHARVRIQSIVVSTDGRATLYFKDGGLFYEHVIEVRLRKTASVGDVCLAG